MSHFTSTTLHRVIPVTRSRPASTMILAPFSSPGKQWSKLNSLILRSSSTAFLRSTWFSSTSFRLGNRRSPRFHFLPHPYLFLGSSLSSSPLPTSGALDSGSTIFGQTSSSSSPCSTFCTASQHVHARTFIPDQRNIPLDVQRQVSTIQAFHSTTRNTSMKWWKSPCSLRVLLQTSLVLMIRGWTRLQTKTGLSMRTRRGGFPCQPKAVFESRIDGVQRRCRWVRLRAVRGPGLAIFSVVLRWQTSRTQQWQM